MSIVQLSRFLSFFSSDSLYRLSQHSAFVKNFFSSAFDLVFLPPSPDGCPPAPGRSASASPASWLSGRFPPSSATGAILSPQEGIVNVFLVFYLFQTIHAISVYILLLFCTFTLFIISSDHNFLLPLFSINILLYSAKESTDEITYWKLGSVLHISSAPVK